MKKDYNKTLIRGASVLALGTFLSKLLGVFYRIPLTNLLGAEGLGVYQMIFPVYALLLDFAGCGVPNAISKLVATEIDNKEVKAKKYLIASIKLFAVFGTICFLFMLLFSSSISNLQGNENAKLGYILLSPAVLIVSLISCFRGYFQGLMNMKPTAISQIIEQTVKIFLGLILIKFSSKNLEKMVGRATLAITVAEAVALIYLLIVYLRKNRNNSKQLFILKKEYSLLNKTLLKTTIPITLVSIILPLSQVIDSFLIINLISKYSNLATTLYGILSGVVLTVINLPVSICHAVSTVSIPSVSSSSDNIEQNRRAQKSIYLTLFLAIPSGIFCYYFAPFIIKLLFKRLSFEENIIAVNLLKLTSPCVILLSLLQTLNAILIGKGKLYAPVVTLLIGVFIKTILNLVLLNKQSLNIYAGGISLIACYFVSCLVNLILIFKLKVKNANARNFNREYAS